MISTRNLYQLAAIIVIAASCKKESKGPRSEWYPIKPGSRVQYYRATEPTLTARIDTFSSYTTTNTEVFGDYVLWLKNDEEIVLCSNKLPVDLTLLKKNEGYPVSDSIIAPGRKIYFNRQVDPFDTSKTILRAEVALFETGATYIRWVVFRLRFKPDLGVVEFNVDDRRTDEHVRYGRIEL